MFLPGSHAFQGVQNIFSGSGERLVVPHDRAVKLDPAFGAKGVLLALATTVHHVFTVGCEAMPLAYPDLIIGHGIMGQLLARMVVAAGRPALVVMACRDLAKAERVATEMQLRAVLYFFKGAATVGRRLHCELEADLIAFVLLTQQECKREAATARFRQKHEP